MLLLNYLRRCAPYLAGGMLVVSLILWLWTANLLRRERESVVGVDLPQVGGIFADERGVHLLAVTGPAPGGPVFHPRPSTYAWGSAFNLLGVVFLSVPIYVSACYSTPSYVGLILPYWLLIGASGWLLAVTTPAVEWLASHGWPSRLASLAASGTLTVFLLVNLFPFASYTHWPTSTSNPYEWILIKVMPDIAYREAKFDFGFPFCYYERAVVQGTPVEYFQGRRVGWKPHKAMENLGLALLAALAVLIAVEWRQRRLAEGEPAPKS